MQNPEERKIASIEETIESVRKGIPVIVTDDENRENEGDFVLSAQLATRETIAWAVRYSSGLLCAPMTDEVANRLDLPMMVEHNEDVRSTAYTVTVDAAEGITTGISAHDRMTTLHVLADPKSGPQDLRRPGHVLPLRAVAGGVRERAGHTEASVELMRLAGLEPVAVIAEIVADDGEMMRMKELLEFGARENIPVTTIEKLIEYLEHKDAGAPSRPSHDRDRINAASTDSEEESSPQPIEQASEGEKPACHTRAPHTQYRVSARADTLIPTVYGPIRTRLYRDTRLGVDHLALISLTEEGDLPRTNPLVRIHSECLTGEAFGSLKCECGPQLQAALRMIAETGGIVIYLRGHEGRGIGLANKLRAYELQEKGFNTLEANLELGLPADAREYAAAVEILRDLDIEQIRLLTNNPNKMQQLSDHGISITERVPLLVDVNSVNEEYLATKRDLMGHLLPQKLSGTLSAE